MRKITLASTAIFGAMLVLSLHATPARATSPRTWVSGTGTNNSLCSRTSPCATFQAAHDATTAGGEIGCIDAGDFGQLSINKAISIICDNTEASIVVVNAGFGIEISAGASDIVTLKGLDIDGTGVGFEGINFLTGAALHVNKVHIRNFNAGVGSSMGLNFHPANYSELYVTDSFFTDNGSASQPFNGGIVIRPGGSGSANVSINRVRFQNNAVGILVDASGSTGVAVNATILDSVVAGSGGDGIAAATSAGHAAVNILFDHSVASGNFGSGLKADGGGAGSATVRIGDSTIVLNVTGVSTSGGGVAQSFKNNRISGNLTDGTPIPAFPGPGGTALQ